MALNIRKSRRNFIAAAQRDFRAENDLTVSIIQNHKKSRKEIEKIAAAFEKEIEALEIREEEEQVELTTSKLIAQRKAKSKIDKIIESMYKANTKSSKATSEKVYRDRVSDEFARFTINTKRSLKVVQPSDRVIDNVVNGPITENTLDSIMDKREKKLKERMAAILAGVVLLGTSSKGLSTATRLGRLVIDDKTFKAPIKSLFKSSLGPINKKDRIKVISSKDIGGDVKGNVSVTKSQVQKSKVRGQDQGRKQVGKEVKVQLGERANVTTVVIWRTMQDNLVRDSHSAMDGQIKGSLTPGGYVSGDGNIATGPREFGDPAEDANCRCEEETQYTIN